ncbi:MAG: DUF2460 domain-containing protein [Rickettsiales bacterium]|jgi:uncharacterized protein (TIGR02217 family)|nr:DUF2460 domain-containing protein [Rickettsiales bacterium]
MNFPENIAFNSSSLIEYSTNIVNSKNGNEFRNINWHKPRLKFNVKNGIKTKNELNELMLFFRKMQGRFGVFDFKDWTDHKANMQEIGIGDGVKTNFQLIKHYDEKVRIITRPKELKIYINNIEYNNFNVENGVVIFDIPPNENAIIVADFEFDVSVRFDNDTLEVSLDTFNSGNVKDIFLIEV